MPFEDFKLDFFGGAHATLATPEALRHLRRDHFADAMEGGHAREPGSPAFGISTGCVSGFAPAFTAGTATRKRAPTPRSTLSFGRARPDQDLSGLTVSLPPGLLGKVAGVQQCTDAQLAGTAAKSGAAERPARAVPLASLIGTSRPAPAPGKTRSSHPAMPISRAPIRAPPSAGVVIPALAGPFDLGNCRASAGLHIDPTTAQVTAVSDPFPTILQGIPLRMRRDRR